MNSINRMLVEIRPEEMFHVDHVATFLRIRIDMDGRMYTKETAVYLDDLKSRLDVLFDAAKEEFRRMMLQNEAADPVVVRAPALPHPRTPQPT